MDRELEIDNRTDKYLSLEDYKNLNLGVVNGLEHLGVMVEDLLSVWDNTPELEIKRRMEAIGKRVVSYAKFERLFHDVAAPYMKDEDKTNG